MVFILIVIFGVPFLKSLHESYNPFTQLSSLCVIPTELSDLMLCLFAHPSAKKLIGRLMAGYSNSNSGCEDIMKHKSNIRCGYA
jgi:hypothetical protein